jgi:hypothetical protein
MQWEVKSTNNDGWDGARKREFKIVISSCGFLQNSIIKALVLAFPRN